MMYPSPPCIRARRFSCEVKPRSATQITFNSVHARRSFFTCRISPESAVFTGQDHTRTGIPSRVTAIPTMPRILVVRSLTAELLERRGCGRCGGARGSWLPGARHGRCATAVSSSAGTPLMPILPLRGRARTPASKT